MLPVETNHTLQKVITQIHENNIPTFLIPTKFISPEAALIGQFFHMICNDRCLQKTRYKSFFCNSRIEALQGVIKIFRQHAKPYQSKTILVFDSSNAFQRFLDPCHRQESGLIPGITFLNDITAFREKITPNSLQGVVFYATNHDELNHAGSIFSECSEKNILCALGLSDLLEEESFQNPFTLTHAPDAFFFGESFTDSQVPFGTFSMSEKCYRPWDNLENCLTHSSTYSGNLLTLKYILEKFHSHKLFENISYPKTRKEIVRMYSAYVNPHAAIIYGSLNLSPEVSSSQGSWLTSPDKNQPKLLDCIGNSGCSLRGHNPNDIIPHVVNKHSHEHNYQKDLEDQLLQLTQLEHLFPATSGSIAVEIAIQVALLAVKKRKILSFYDNYSGKTLGALSLDGYEEVKRSFYPLFDSVIFFDPFAKDAPSKLEQIIISEDVGIVWFEILQGNTIQEIPMPVLEKLKSLQTSHDIIIGVDEILTGCYRTGKFLISQHFNLLPDVITLSKGLSDMTFPFACAMVSDKIYSQAYKKSSDSIELYSTLYSNQFAAHIALNALSQAKKFSLGANAEMMGKKIREDLTHSIKQTKLFKEIRGRGLLLYVAPTPNLLSVKVLGKDIFGFIFSSYLVREHQVFLFNCRVTPSLTITHSETEFLKSNFEAAIKYLTSAQLFLETLKVVTTIYLKSFFHRFKRFKDSLNHTSKPFS